MRLPWYENKLVRWRRGPTGKLHAQWTEDEGGESVHSEDSGLSGPAVPYDSALACAQCCSLVRSVLLRNDTPQHVLQGKGNLGGCSVEVRELNRLRLDRVRDAARTHDVTVRLLCSWWPDVTISAASMMLSRWAKNGKLRRVDVGVYGLPKEKP